MKKSTLFLALFALFACGCAGKKSDEYATLKNSGLTGDALYGKLIAFDKEHPGSFDSKLDLASYYFISGNRGDAWKYALKAEGLLVSVKSVVPQKRALLFALLSALYAADEDADKARAYAKKAYEVPDSGAEYGYLYAKMQLLHGAESEALALFDKTYSRYPDRIAPDELRSYMYLLADAGEFQKCAELFEPYFETGGFFPGLGLFASTVYEKLGDTEKAVLCAFLDYEYSAGGKEKDDELHALLRYLCEKQATSHFTQTIDGLVESTKNNEKFRSVYMSLNIHRDDLLRQGSLIGEKIGFERGVVAGMRKGRRQGFSDGSRRKALEDAGNLKRLGVSIDIITQATGLSKQEVENI